MYKRNYEFNWLGFGISFALLAALFVGIWFLWMPAWNFASPSMWGFFILAIATTSIISTAIGGFYEEIWLPTGICALVALGLLAIWGIFAFASCQLFHVEDYRAIAQITTVENATEILPDANTMPIIDRNTARKLGDRTMGSIDAKYVGQFEVSNEYNLIVYQGEDYYLAPLEYGGLLKYGNTKDVGIIGYVLVNARTGEAQRVDLSAEYTIRYAPSAFWGYDLGRHLRMQRPGTMFGDINFEIDDEGHPYYIVTTVKSTAGLFGAKRVDSVILVDAHTGELQEYAPTDTPEWVDHVYDVERLMKQVAWHYDLVRGCWNFSSKDVLKTSYIYDTNQYYCFVKDGHTWVYTGVTSAGSDESNVGFLAMSLRTGEYIYVKSAGAEESSAQKTATGLVQQYGYSAGPVILLNLGGEESYFCTLKDEQGLVKMYALISKADYNKVVVESTFDKAIISYGELMGITIPYTPSDPTVETPNAYTAEGVVSEVYEVTVDGNTMFIFYLEGKDEFFVSAIGNNFEQPKKLTPSSVVAIVYNVVNNANVVSEINFK